MGDELVRGINFILQNFDRAVLQCLEAGKEQIKNYKELIFIYSKKKTPHPAETEGAIRSFCAYNGLGFHRLDEVHPECMIPGQLYFVVTENDLVQVLKGCRISGLSVGTELGIISYNDTPMKEIAANGISVISTDFKEMGRKAAGFVANKQKIREVLPTRLILRGSL